jgi:hypothetical protein
LNNRNKILVRNKPGLVFHTREKNLGKYRKAWKLSFQSVFALSLVRGGIFLDFGLWALGFGLWALGFGLLSEFFPATLVQIRLKKS